MRKSDKKNEKNPIFHENIQTAWKNHTVRRKIGIFEHVVALLKDHGR
jgi:hypothetical protein